MLNCKISKSLIEVVVNIVQIYRFTFISNKFVGREYLQVSKRQDGIGVYYITGKATEVSSMYIS